MHSIPLYNIHINKQLDKNVIIHLKRKVSCPLFIFRKSITNDKEKGKIQARKLCLLVSLIIQFSMVMLLDYPTDVGSVYT